MESWFFYNQAEQIYAQKSQKQFMSYLAWGKSNNVTI
jgi:hypothetical protein